MLSDPALPRTALLEVAQVAHRLNFTPRVVWQLIRDGDLPAYRIKSRLRVKEADLDAYINAQKVQIAREEEAIDQRFRSVKGA